MSISPRDESVRTADLRRRCWISKASSHEPCRLSRKPDYTKRKSRDGSNSSAKSRMSGAHTSRATIRAIPYRSCAGSIVFNFSTTGVAGGFYQFTGSTKLRSTRFRKISLTFGFVGMQMLLVQLHRRTRMGVAVAFCAQAQQKGSHDKKDDAFLFRGEDELVSQ